VYPQSNTTFLICLRQTADVSILANTNSDIRGGLSSFMNCRELVFSETRASFTLKKIEEGRGYRTPSLPRNPLFGSGLFSRRRMLPG
jgi:hypothetical protein